MIMISIDLANGGLRTVVDVLQARLIPLQGNRCQQRPLRSQMAICRSCNVMLLDRVVIRHSTYRDKYTTMTSLGLVELGRWLHPQASLTSIRTPKYRGRIPEVHSIHPHLTTNSSSCLLGHNNRNRNASVELPMWRCQYHFHRRSGREGQ